MLNLILKIIIVASIVQTTSYATELNFEVKSPQASEDVLVDKTNEELEEKKEERRNQLIRGFDFALQTKKSFQVLTIHDCYGCHPNYMNDLRRNYNHILANMHRSNILQDILRQLYNDK